MHNSNSLNKSRNANNQSIKWLYAGRYCLDFASLWVRDLSGWRMECDGRPVDGWSVTAPI